MEVQSAGIENARTLKMALTIKEREQKTNRLLYFLSQAPQGLTTRQLQEQTGELSKEQIVDWLKARAMCPCLKLRRKAIAPASGRTFGI